MYSNKKNKLKNKYNTIKFNQKDRIDITEKIKAKFEKRMEKLNLSKYLRA